MCSFRCDDNFVNQMMFDIDGMNTKVVYNFMILFVLKFHDHRPDGLGVMNFTNALTGFV